VGLSSLMDSGTVGKLVHDMRLEVKALSGGQ